MALTLPGVLGRVFTAATNLFQTSQIASETYTSRVVLGDGTTNQGDGTEDLTGTAFYSGEPSQPDFYIRSRPGRMAMLLRGESNAGIRNILQIEDYLGFTIFSLANAGGIYLNDNLRVAFGTFTGFNFWVDIYGNMQLGSALNIFAHAGPPGNILSWPDAVGEQFQRARGSAQGTWTATNAAYSAQSVNNEAGYAPSGYQYVRRWTASAAGNIVATTGNGGPLTSTGIYGYPCPPSTFVAAQIKTLSATVARSKQLGLVFYNAAGTAIGSPTTGSAATDNVGNALAVGTYTTLAVQAVSPAGTAYCALQLTITGAAGSGEAHFDSCAGIWVGLTSSSVTAWSPPQNYRQDAFCPGAYPVTGCTGSGVSPIVISMSAGHAIQVGDTVTTTGIGGNTNANQAGVAVTARSTTSVTIAGTGNAAYTSGGSVQMNYSAQGLYDGAYAGDVYIRADGPANVVQRFYTNAVSALPSGQNWVSDPRIFAQPSRINWYGGNHLQQGNPSDPDYVLPLVATGMMHNDPPDSVNRGFLTPVGSWNLLSDASNAQAFGGQAAFTQAVRKKSSGAPYVSKDGMFVFYYGLWDLANDGTGGGSGEMSQLNGTTGSTGGTGSITHTLRDMISHARASNILPYTNAAFTFANTTGASASGVVQYAFSGGGPGVGGTMWQMPTVGNSFTFTVPADFAGGAVTISLIPGVGSFGGVLTWTGTLFTTGGIANPGTFSTSNITGVGSGARARACIRFTGLTSAHAGLTIIGTVSSLDSGGQVQLDCAYIEGQYPNLVAVCGMPQLPTNTGYVNLGGAGSYWNGNSGSTGNTDVATLNTNIQAMVAQFDSNCFYVDMNSALQAQASYFASDSCTLNALGVHAMAQQLVTAIEAQLPLVNFRNVNHDYHDTTIAPVGGPFSKQGLLQVTTGVSRFYADDYYYLSNVRASVNTAPQGASIIVDVFKNGSTIFTTTGNRATITAGTFTATSSPPDLLFVQPGDYLTVNVAQVGTGVNPGADLTVNVLGRKIPIP